MKINLKKEKLDQLVSENDDDGTGEFDFGKNTLETSGEDVKLHSKRVEKTLNYTQNEWRKHETTLKTSGEDVKLHSKRVEKT